MKGKGKWKNGAKRAEMKGKTKYREEARLASAPLALS